MNNLNVRVYNRKNKDGQYYWEATATIPGFKPTKITRPDGTTQFASRSAVTGAARSRAKSLGFAGVEYTGESAESPQVARKAAKKSARTNY